MSRSLLLILPLLLVCSPAARAQEGRKIAVPVSEFPTAQGRWDRLTNAVSTGRIYDFAISMDTYQMDSYTKESRVVFANPGDFDRLECWVGLAQQQHSGQTRFLVAGDGVLLYRSQWMTWRDRAEKVSVSVKGYKGISLIVQGTNMNKFDMAIWGEPVLVQSDAPALTESRVRLPDLMTVRQASNGSIGILIGGAPIEFGAAKMLNDGGGLMVPIRPIFEALGARINYNSASRQIVATRGDQTIAMAVGAPTATINGRAVSMDAAPRVISGETLVPLRFVAEAFGVPVEYQR